MKTPHRSPALLAALTLTLISQPLAAAPYISEFLASNTAGITDEDGAFSDWLEIHNPDPAAVSLAGSFLTDDPGDLTKWMLPDVALPAGGYIVLFASGKDRTDPAGELHTSFRLNRGGEYLALVMPDGATVASQFSPEYPDQLDDISYGLGVIGNVSVETLIAPGADCTWWVPDAETATDWRTPSFDDAAWSAGQTGVGYGYPGLIGAGGDVDSQMRNINASVYIRIPFQISNPADVVKMTMRLKWEDGFEASLNGTPVAAENAPVNPAFDSIASANHPDAQAEVYDDYDLNFVGGLVSGTNILAVQGMNRTIGSSDLLILPELIAEISDPEQLLGEGFFEEPTPGLPNAGGKAAPEEVKFSAVSGTFTSNFQLVLSASPGATIRYTTDRSLPVDTLGNPSPEYSGPIAINASTQVRARVFNPGAIEGPVRTETYFKLAPDLQNFTSDLPLLVIDSFGTNIPDSGSTSFATTWMAIFDTKEDGRSSLSNPPDVVARTGARRRGSSTAGRAKYSLRLETWDEFGDDKDIEPFDMPGEADWVLSGRYNFDRALLRNPFMYELSNQIGRYAVRTQFVEVIHDTDTDGQLAYSDYFGVYTFMESIKGGRDRVDVPELSPGDNTEPDITGGYLLKVDRSDPDGGSFSAGGATLQYNEPNATEITAAQRSYLTNYVNGVGNSLGSSDPDTGYPAWIDSGTWIDEHILRTLSKDPDGLRLSTYLFKDRGGKLSYGPVWDFDRTIGCDDDGRAFDPNSWAPADYFFTHTWWNRLLGSSALSGGPGANPDFWQEYKDRWHELRQDQMSVANMDAIVDAMADELREAQARNFQRWPLSLGGSAQYTGGVTGWEGEVLHVKGWLEDRVNWIDSQFLTVPSFNQNGGVVPDGFELAMSSVDGSVWYTTDGSDPRARGGAPSANAIQFPGGPITRTYIESEVGCKYLVPADGSLALTWTATGFDDSAWGDGTTGLGWETSGPLLDLINTDMRDQMYNINPGVYLRFEFEFDNQPANINELILKVKYDDGFVAYLNGVEVASGNKPSPLDWDSRASASHPDSLAQQFELSDITAFKGAMLRGSNVLAIHAMNSSISGSDMFILPELEIDETVVPTPLALAESTFVTARTFDGSVWSAPARANFVVGADLASSDNLVISEIMYRPAGVSAEDITAGFPNRDLFEFAELQNIGPNTLDLRDVRFTTGIVFTFADGAITSLEPGERVLLVKNQAAFEHRYGDGFSDRVAGEFQNDTNLSNDGEQLVLLGAGDAVIRDFSYNDVAPWPTAPDGGGPSLVLLRPETNPDHALPENWRASALPGGSPATSDSVFFVGDPDGDDNGNGISNLVEHALGPGAGEAFAVEIGTGGLPEFSHRRNLAADDVAIAIEASGNLSEWEAAGVELISEVYHADGTATLTYRATAPTEEQFVRLRATLLE